MKRVEGKSKINQRKKEINYYCIFNNEKEQLSNKIKTIFKEHLDALNLNTQNATKSRSNKCAPSSILPDIL